MLEETSTPRRNGFFLEGPASILAAEPEEKHPTAWSIFLDSTSNDTTAEES